MNTNKETDMNATETTARTDLNPDTLISRWNNLFATSVHDVQHEERLYIVTDGTGEGVFAYAASDFADGLAAAEAAHTEAYAAFCDACTPEADEDLARAVYAATGLQICRGGSCSRVVDFDAEDEDEDDEDEDDEDDEDDAEEISEPDFDDVAEGLDPGVYLAGRLNPPGGVTHLLVRDDGTLGWCDQWGDQEEDYRGNVSRFTAEELCDPE